ncbi:hypothetical protein DL98DRAFT_59346 [Cadophora sp. DSE1049]|nr:hypothetical protein DL98DRAFT_59346 [Cadophora sp. DSE1049]
MAFQGLGIGTDHFLAEKLSASQSYRAIILGRRRAARKVSRLKSERDKFLSSEASSHQHKLESITAQSSGERLPDDYPVFPQIQYASKYSDTSSKKPEPARAINWRIPWISTTLLFAPPSSAHCPIFQSARSHQNPTSSSSPLDTTISYRI